MEEGGRKAFIGVHLGSFDVSTQSRLAGALSGDPHIRLLVAEQSRAPDGLTASVAIFSETAEEDLGAFRASEPATGVIVLAEDPRRIYGMLLLDAGVSCLARNSAAGEILAAVYLAARGDCLFLSADGQRMERRRARQLHELTAREREVLALLSRDKKPAEIALALRIGVETVRTHTASIRRKLGVKSSRELRGVSVPHHAGTTSTDTSSCPWCLQVIPQIHPNWE